MVQVYMLSLSSQPVDHEEPGKQMVLGDQVSLGILEQSRNRVGIGLSYRPARLRRLAESIPRLLKSLKIPPLAVRYDNPIKTRFLAPIDCSKITAQAPFPFHLQPPSFSSYSTITSHLRTLFPYLFCSLPFIYIISPF